jgi:hypothetical protein
VRFTVAAFTASYPSSVSSPSSPLSVSSPAASAPHGGTHNSSGGRERQVRMRQLETREHRGSDYCAISTSVQTCKHTISATRFHPTIDVFSHLNPSARAKQHFILTPAANLLLHHSFNGKNRAPATKQNRAPTTKKKSSRNPSHHGGTT